MFWLINLRSHTHGIAFLLVFYVLSVFQQRHPIVSADLGQFIAFIPKYIIVVVTTVKSIYNNKLYIIIYGYIYVLYLLL